MPTDLPQLLGEVRELTAAFKAGDRESAPAFRDLVALFFRITIGGDGTSPRLTYRQGNRDRSVLAGMGGPTDPLRLSDGRYLKMAITLLLTDTDAGRRLKVLDSSYQYQADIAGEDWIFRYDYERSAQNRHPPAHFHVRAGLLTDGCLAPNRPLERVHFPTLRVSVEAIVRLLAEQFDVPCAEPPEVWRAVLAESEQLFAEIAHQPLSGPPGLVE